MVRLSERSDNLSEREKEILNRITKKVPTLETNEQNYILGVVEGMALMKEQKDEEEANAHE